MTGIFFLRMVTDTNRCIHINFLFLDDEDDILLPPVKFATVHKVKCAPTTFDTVQIVKPDHEVKVFVIKQ